MTVIRVLPPRAALKRWLYGRLQSLSLKPKNPPIQLEASIGLINRKILKKSRSEQTIYAEAAIPGICVRPVL